jgi:cytochrome c553
MKASTIPTVLRLCAALAALAPWGAAAHAADAAPSHVPDTLAERVRACTACHGREGRATPFGYFPRIAGKPAGYLFEQLLHFRDGRRDNPLMSGLVRHLSDDYLREIAGWFASQDLPYPAPQPATLGGVERERAAALVTHGDVARGVPACTRCHGDAMTGVLPAVPGLLGLPRDYLVAQFGAWRNGTRHAAAPDCMHRVAQALSAEEVSLVANWLAAQPVPADAHPVAALAQPRPLECGSGRAADASSPANAATANVATSTASASAASHPGAAR